MQIMMRKDHDFGLHQPMQPSSYAFYHAARSARSRAMMPLLVSFVAVTRRRFRKSAMFVVVRGRRGDVPQRDSPTLRELALRRNF
jgi:hypothetical protein